MNSSIHYSSGLKFKKIYCEFSYSRVFSRAYETLGVYRLINESN